LYIKYLIKYLTDIKFIYGSKRNLFRFANFFLSCTFYYLCSQWNNHVARNILRRNTI